VYGTVDRVDLNSRGDIEPGLLKAQAHPPGAGEEIDSEGAFGHARFPFCSILLTSKITFVDRKNWALPKNS
jgi:hypothetical protein